MDRSGPVRDWQVRRKWDGGGCELGVQERELVSGRENPSTLAQSGFGVSLPWSEAVESSPGGPLRGSHRITMHPCTKKTNR